MVQPFGGGPFPAVGSGSSDPAFDPVSASGGGLLLASATYSPAGTGTIATSATETYQGIQIVAGNSATAVVNSIPDADTWTWELDEGDAVNLAARPSVLTILERSASVFPSLLSVVVGFVDNGDPKAAAGNGWGVEFGWPSTTVRRVGYLLRAGSTWSRTVGAGVAGTHFGVDCHVRPHTHTDVAQGRAYPRGSDGQRSSVPGVNTQGSTIQVEGRMTHFFVAVMWNSTSGATPTLTFDPAYWIGDASLHS